METKYVDTKYINSMTPEQLRNELTLELERKFALMAAFRELPEVAPVPALYYLSDFASTKDWERGHTLKGKYPLEVIPPVSECETGAGLWVLLREALSKANA